MSPAVDSPKVVFAREWFARGECPSCGAALAKVAGQGNRHARGGASANNGGTAGPGYLCPWSADDLTSLVLLATDFGRAPDLAGEAAATLPTAASPAGTPTTGDDQ